MELGFLHTDVSLVGNCLGLLHTSVSVDYQEKIFLNFNETSSLNKLLHVCQEKIFLNFNETSLNKLYNFYLKDPNRTQPNLTNLAGKDLYLA